MRAMDRRQGYLPASHNSHPFDDDETALAAAIGRIDVVGLSAATAGTVDAGGGFCNTFLALFEALAM